MNQPEHEVARKVVQHLDAGLDRLEAGTRERLAAARRAALARYREAPAPVLGLAWAGQVVARIAGHPLPYGTRLMVATAALVIMLGGVIYWQNPAPNGDLADIEIALLTDELPINAYLDKGFDSWLKRSPR